MKYRIFFLILFSFLPSFLFGQEMTALDYVNHYKTRLEQAIISGDTTKISDYRRVLASLLMTGEIAEGNLITFSNQSLETITPKKFGFRVPKDRSEIEQIESAVGVLAYAASLGNKKSIQECDSNNLTPKKLQDSQGTKAHRDVLNGMFNAVLSQGGKAVPAANGAYQELKSYKEKLEPILEKGLIETSPYLGFLKIKSDVQLDKVPNTPIPSWVTSLVYNGSILSVKGSKKTLPQLISEVKTLPAPKQETLNLPDVKKIAIDSMGKLLSALSGVIGKGGWKETAIVSDFDETLGVRSYKEKGNGTPRMLYVSSPDYARVYKSFFEAQGLCTKKGGATEKMSLIEEYMKTLEEYYRLIEPQAMLQNMVQSLYTKGATVNICSGQRPEFKKTELLDSIGVKDSAYSFIYQDKDKQETTKAQSIARRLLRGFSTNPAPETIVLIDNSQQVLEQFVDDITNSDFLSELPFRPKKIITVHYTKFEELLKKNLAQENKALDEPLKAYQEEEARKEAAAAAKKAAAGKGAGSSDDDGGSEEDEGEEGDEE